MTPSTDLRVLIIAEHASFKFGGEAILPVHYSKACASAGVEAWLITHSRTRAELESAFPNDQSRIHYLPDTLGAKTLYRLGKPLPAPELLHLRMADAHVHPARARKLAPVACAICTSTSSTNPSPSPPRSQAYSAAWVRC